MIKITPARGAPYYMVDHVGNGTFARQDNLRQRHPAADVGDLQFLASGGQPQWFKLSADRGS